MERDWSKEIILPHPTYECKQPGCDIRTDSESGYCRHHTQAHHDDETDGHGASCGCVICESERRSDEDTVKTNARYLDGGWADRTEE